MGLANCRQCGKLYLENNFNMCPECIRAQEEDELKVVAYLRDVVDYASVDEIHEATGVKTKTIVRMIQQGRIVGADKITYHCDGCGKLISHGRLCSECSENILSQMAQSVKRASEKEEEAKNKAKGIRMYSKEKK
ncbi:MAG: flagellar protein [Sporomusaceae bacterium]|nr:flagellar protein [Sporomusaceae bacterium]